MTGGCDCTELCAMGPTCPGGILARLPGSGCDTARGVQVPPVVQEALVDLFGAPVAAPIDPVPGEPHNARLSPKRRRRTDVVADRIAVGRHPLTNGPLHPEASRDRDRSSSGDDPFTCGSCVHRGIVGHHTRSYPKCLIPGPGSTDQPPPEALYDRERDEPDPNGRKHLARSIAYGQWYAARYPRVSRSDATDVRAWWPACPAYEPRDTPPDNVDSTPC